MRMFVPMVLAMFSLPMSIFAQGSSADYRVIQSWPTLPKNVTLGAVSGVAVDAHDHVWIFHRGTPPVIELDAEGKMLRSWGESQLKNAHGLRFDREGHLWTTDLDHHQVMKFSVEGKVLLTLGTKGKSGLSESHFNKPTDIAFGPDGAIYVSDGYGNSRVVKFSKEGKFLKSWGKRGKGIGEFNTPHAIQIDEKGIVYVGDRENDRVQLFDLEGKFLRQWNRSGAPYGLALTKSRHMLLADGRAELFRLLSLEGETVGRWGSKGTLPGDFRLPHAVAEDSKGNVYVTEITGKRVQKFTRMTP